VKKGISPSEAMKEGKTTTPTRKGLFGDRICRHIAHENK